MTLDLGSMKREKITPQKATLYLNDNKANRKLRDGVVEKYAHDMKNGRWTNCPAPISFYEDGDVADGQHRLWAIVEANIPVSFFVLRGLTREDGLNIDTGLNRSIVDNSRISGADDGLSNALVSLSIFYHFGNTSKNSRALSNAERLEIIKKYRPQCDWAVSNGPTGKGFRNSLTLAAVARAYAHGEDPERLKCFCEVLSKGFSGGTEDSAAVAIRNYIISHNFKVLTTEPAEFFRKIQNAISYFMRRKPMNYVKNVKEEAYPISVKKKK